MTAFDKFIIDMKLYITTNINVHVGNLYEHSVWSVLYAEDITDSSVTSTKLKRFISVAAFLHDVGKMTERYVYYSIPDHPRIGRDYVRGSKLLPHSGINVRTQIVPYLGLNDDFIPYLEFVVDNHKLLGDVATAYVQSSSSSSIEEYATTFVAELVRRSSVAVTKDLIRSLCIVSIADAMATMNAFGKDGDRSSSTQLPFLVNCPQVHRGGMGSWQKEFDAATAIAAAAIRTAL